MGIYDFFGVDKPFDPSCTLVTSNVFSPAVLVVFRLLIAVYTLVTLIVVMCFDGIVHHDLNSFFSYFTHLSYIGLCAYFWASSVQTIAYASAARHGRATYPLQQWPRFLQLLHLFLTCTVYVAPFIVTIVFWTLLADHAFDTKFDAWSNTSVHILNSVFALADIVLGRCTPAWSNIPILISICGAYIGLAYITYATQHFYTYNFFDPSKQGAKVAAYVFGILISTIIILAIVKAVCWVRDRTLRYYRNPGPDHHENDAEGIYLAQKA